MAPATASDPKTTIVSPTAGSVTSATAITVRGTYSADDAVKDVRVAVCKLDTKGLCTSYLSDFANGTFITKYISIPANRTPSSQVAGTFSLTGSKLTPGRYKAAAFTVTSSNPKGTPHQVIFSLSGTTPPPGGDGYITVMFGRSNWSVADGNNCTIVPTGVRTLEQNLIDLKGLGVKAVGGVVVNRTQETARTCVKGTGLQPSWADLTRLRENYDFTVVSQGMNYADMTKMTTDAQRFGESGATLPIFNSRGFTRASGAFFFPNDKLDAAAQQVVSKDFFFLRKYGTRVNTRAAVTTYPYLMQTISVMGGRCNNRDLPCFTMPMKNDRRTAPPSRLAHILSPKANEWGVVQFYRLVEGSYGKMGDDFAWDCSSTKWQDRWTSQPEIYCRNNFLSAIQQRKGDAKVVEPTEVAQAWGRTLD